MPSFEKSLSPYRIDFYDITLISEGAGTFWLDNQPHPLKKNRVLFTTPGQVRRWIADDLEGLCLFFPAEFLLEHFNDAMFLHRLRYFHSHSGPFYLDLSDMEYLKLRDRLACMHEEISQLKPDSPHLLRAIAYEVMVNLNRWFAASHGQKLDTDHEHTVTKFRHLIAQQVHQKHNVADYANKLNITPGHLNYLCKTHLGQTASQLISSKLISEAGRLLVHSNMDINLISQHLGFTDPSYFSRYFKRAVGHSPKQYRQVGQQRLLI